MANDTTNENLEDQTVENESLEENIDIGDIEGLEKDIKDESVSSDDSIEGMELPEEEKQEILYDDGPRLEDRIKAMEDSIEKEPLPDFPPKKKKDDEEYIVGAPLLDKHEIEQDDDVEILEHEEDEEDEDHDEKPSFLERLKDKKTLFKLLLGVLIVLIIIIILIFMFLPSKKEMAPAKAKPEPKVETVVQEEPTPVVQAPTYEFKLDHINITRVNKKLETLTKYELLGMSEDEYLRQEKLKAEQKAKEEAQRLEQERIAKEEAERKAKEEAERLEQERLALEAAELKAKEEAAKMVAENEAQKEGTTTETATENSTEENSMDAMSDNTFLKFVHVPTYKTTLYKTELAKIKDIDARINPCRNSKNMIEIFIGPLKGEEQYSDIVKALNTKANYKNIKMLELTKDEFENRCMVY